ncbi:MAG: hypothetical protein MJ208_03120, partial [Bacilli bacterium]|nr:hypothetical protein [Bacilli bacterium]
MFGEAEFSVALGVVDLFPTLIYLAFIIYVGYFLFKKINIYLWIIFIMGGALSVISGITLAIFKILVGLNGEAFKLPVYLFCLLSIGVAVSSVPLFISTFKKSKSTYLFSFAPVLAAGGELIFN